MSQIPLYVFYTIQGLIGTLFAIFWFRDNDKYRKIEALQERLQKTREEYVHKEDLKEWKADINHRFDKLEALLRDKQVKVD